MHEHSTNDFRSSRGASLVEYLLLALFIVVVCVVGVKSIGYTVSESLSDSADAYDGGG